MDGEAYASLMAELAAAGETRADVLAQRGLDEARWDAIDTAFQHRLSEAVDTEDDGVPEILARYAAAYEKAQSVFSPLISIEDLARVTRVFSATGDLRAALSRAGVQLSDFLRGSQHWSRRMAEDPESARAFEAALREG